MKHQSLKHEISERERASPVTTRTASTCREAEQNAVPRAEEHKPGHDENRGKTSPETATKTTDLVEEVMQINEIDAVEGGKTCELGTSFLRDLKHKMKKNQEEISVGRT